MVGFLRVLVGPHNSTVHITCLNKLRKPQFNSKLFTEDQPEISPPTDIHLKIKNKKNKNIEKVCPNLIRFEYLKFIPFTK